MKIWIPLFIAVATVLYYSCTKNKASTLPIHFVNGIVKDAITGIPIAGMPVFLSQSSPSLGFSTQNINTTTDKNGNYQFQFYAIPDYLIGVGMNQTGFYWGKDTFFTNIPTSLVLMNSPKAFLKLHITNTITPSPYDQLILLNVNFGNGLSLADISLKGVIDTTFIWPSALNGGVNDSIAYQVCKYPNFGFINKYFKIFYPELDTTSYTLNY